MLLEQCLPFTVLKLDTDFAAISNSGVGTVLTVYGIETNTEITYICIASTKLEQCLPFTVLKLKGVSPFLYDKLGWNSAYRLRY